MEPTRPQERIVEIDILRGFAIFGMILWDFRSRSMGHFYSGGNVNFFISGVISFLDLEGTVHLLFAFLFGWGFAMQMSLKTKGLQVFDAIYLRRLAVLFVIGLIHCFFWYRPDFLHIYAMLGVALLFFANQSKRTILISAMLLIGAPVFIKIILSNFMSPESYYDTGSYDSLKAHIITMSGYSDMAFVRAWEFAREYAHPGGYIMNLDILGTLLIGLYAYRRGVFHNISGNMDFIRKVMLYSFVTLLLGSAWIFTLQHLKIVSRENDSLLFFIYHFICLGGRKEVAEMLVALYSNQAFSLFYLCFIVILLQLKRIKKYFLPLANVGQLALSNYLLHSLIGTTLFYGYGLALYGKLGCAKGEALAVLVFGFQLVISSWWLRYFRFGPAEWLWRSLTYWRFQPMRVPIT
jgi:uncharacterized protein